MVTSDIEPGGRATARMTVPLTCRLNIRHDWHLFHTEDGGRYKACSRCHRESPDALFAMWQYPGDNIRRSFTA